MSGAVREATESAAGTVTPANVKSVMMARRQRRALRALRGVAVGSRQTKMFSGLRSGVVGFEVYVRVMRETM